MTYNDLTIEVDKDVLLKKLKTNRAKHLRAYDTAKTGYYKLLARELAIKQRAIAGYKLKPSEKKYADLSRIANQKPTNYLAYYDQAIEMLEFGQDTTVRLSSEQYQQYVKDEWNWKASFTTSNVAYAAAARRR